jgi:uncharacterized protein YjiS (DUF1127 family)
MNHDRAHLGHGIRRLVNGTIDIVGRWYRQAATRSALMACSDRVLTDIGIEREDVPANRQSEHGWISSRERQLARRFHAAPGKPAPAASRLPRVDGLQRPRAGRARDRARRHRPHRPCRLSGAHERTAATGPAGPNAAGRAPPEGYPARWPLDAAGASVQVKSGRASWRSQSSRPACFRNYRPGGCPNSMTPPDYR